jgi:galactan endo-1,6-beta-galactosidase
MVAGTVARPQTDSMPFARKVSLVLLGITAFVGLAYFSLDAVFALAGANASVTVTPDPTAQFGTWDGWGVSLCWWAHIFGDRDDLADAVFTLKEVHLAGEKLPGLGLNIARYNAGGSAWKPYGGASMEASPNIPKWKQIHGFWEDWGSQDPKSQSWNWTDTKQAAMLRKAHARGANRLELFSNSPMWWMLYNHNPSGADDGSKDNLQSWNYRKHAIYMATVAMHAKDNWGFEFESVDPFNEPMGDWWKSSGTQEGCHFERSTQDVVLPYMREELDRRGLKTIVSASDENTYDAATDTWKALSSASKSAVGRVNVHGYQGSDGRRDLLFSEVAGTPLWNSETGDGDGSGQSLAQNLNLDFKWLHSTAYCYWQVLDESDGWGLLRFDSKKMTIESVNTKYWVFAQYTRHIRPGMKIIDGSADNTIAAYDATSKMLVLVTANFQEQAQKFTFDLSKFPSAQGPIRRWSTNLGKGGDLMLNIRIWKSQGATSLCSFSETRFRPLKCKTLRLRRWVVRRSFYDFKMPDRSIGSRLWCIWADAYPTSRTKLWSRQPNELATS